MLALPRTQPQDTANLHSSQTTLGRRWLGELASISTQSTQNTPAEMLQGRSRNGFLARWCAAMALLPVQLLPFLCEFFLTCSSSPSAPSTAHGAKSHSSSPKTPANHRWERFPASFLSSLHPSQDKDLGKQTPWRGPWSTVSCPRALLILHTGTGRNMEWAHPGFFLLRHGTGCSPRGLWEKENNG